MSIIQSRILKDRIDVYNEETVKNDFSEREKSYRYAFYDRAQALFTNAAERVTNGLETADKTMRFKVRFHRSRYNERQLIKWRGDFYNIAGIDPDTDRVFMIVTGDRTAPDSLKINE